MYSSQQKVTPTFAGSCPLPICRNCFFLHLWMNASICRNVPVLPAHTRLRWGEEQKKKTFEFDETAHMARCSRTVRRTIPIVKPLDCVCEPTLAMSFFFPTEIWDRFVLISQKMEEDGHRFTPNPLQKCAIVQKWGRNLQNKKQKVFLGLRHHLVTLVSSPLSLSSSLSGSLAALPAQ